MGKIGGSSILQIWKLRSERSALPKVIQEDGGPRGQVSEFPPSSALPTTAPSFCPPDSGSEQGWISGGQRDLPEKGAFWFGGDFQAVKKTGGHTLHAESLNLELYCTVCGHLDMPHAVSIGWVRVWVVGAAEETPWARKEAPTGCRDGGYSSEVKRRETLSFHRHLFLASLSCQLRPFSRKICLEYSLDCGVGLMPASCCPLGLPVACGAVVVRPWAGSG